MKLKHISAELVIKICIGLFVVGVLAIASMVLFFKIDDNNAKAKYSEMRNTCGHDPVVLSKDAIGGHVRVEVGPLFVGTGDKIYCTFTELYKDRTGLVTKKTIPQLVQDELDTLKRDNPSWSRAKIEAYR